MKEKILEFIRSKGYIFIALICLAAVVAAGVSLINSDGSKPDVPVVAYKTPGNGKTDTPSQTSKPMPTQPKSTAASKPIDDTGSGNGGGDGGENAGDTSKISIIRPLNGNIQTEFAANKLVYNKTMQEWRTHAGVDIEAAAGTEIKAAANGKISAVKSDPRYGLTVVIDHDINNRAFTTIYCGLDKTAGGIKAGSDVKAGDVIGTLGEDIFCEKAQGAHLHFELTENSIPLDPSEYWE